MKRLLLSAAMIAATFSSFGQLKLPSLSPTTKLTQEFSTSSIEINYSRPSMRGRKIFGDVVPFDKVWRTGANGPTKIKFGEDVDVNGTKVKAGEYVLYAIPGKEEWEVIINTGVGERGPEGFSREYDVVRFKVKTGHTDGMVQTFTMELTDITYNSCKLEIEWEHTKIQIPIKTHNEDNIESNIDKTLNHPSLPYFQVANYYYETNQKTEVALMYVNKALDQDPKAFYEWLLKARIEKRLHHNDKAIEAANKSIETAKGTTFEDEYIHNGNKIIDEIKKGTNLATDKKTY